MIASEKPRSSITSPSTTYMTPMRLWSTLVSHSRHRYGHQPLMVTVTRTARMTMPTTAPLSSGSGSLNGIASQLSLPSMSASRRTQRRMPAPALYPSSACGGGSRHRLLDDALEQLRVHRVISCGGHGLTRLCQLGVTGIVERGPAAARLIDPGVEIIG